MATFRKRGEFQWQAQVRKKGWPLQSKTFNTYAEAEAWAAVIESEMVRGVFVSRAEAERTTLGKIIQRYISEVTPLHRGAKSEELRLNAMARHPIASRSLASLTSTDFASYRDARLRGDIKKGLPPAAAATVHRELGLIQRVIDQARREWGISLAENPVRLVARPKLKNARDRRLSGHEEAYLMAALESGGRDEGGKFIEGTRNPWIAPAVKLALETAMRQGEIVALEWHHVDLKARTAHLPTTKNGSARTVPLSTNAVKVLKALPRSEGRVFPITANALKIAWQRALRRAKENYAADRKRREAKPDRQFLQDLRFHDLRHEATSRLAEKLSNILELAAVTGHQDLQMLKRYYHPRASDLAKKLG